MGGRHLSVVQPVEVDHYTKVRNDLARLLKVKASKLGVVPDRTCTRILNAIKKDPYAIDNIGLSFLALMRTPGVGYKSATLLCRALGLSTKLFPGNEEADPKQDIYRIAEELVQITQGKGEREHIAQSLHEVGTPDFLITDKNGVRYRVSVEKIT